MNEELVKKLKKNDSYEDMFQNFHNDVLQYLESKWPDLPKNEVLETATYTSNRMGVCIQDVLRKRDLEWKMELKRHYEPRGRRPRYIPRNKEEVPNGDR